MEKYISILFIIFFSFTSQPGSSSTQKKKDLTQTIQTKVVYINVFISADKTIFLETEKITFEEVAEKLRKRVRSLPFNPDQMIIYRIYADENLKLGYIMDVSQQMSAGYRPYQTQKFLLNTTKLNLDGQNWLKAVDMKDLKALD
ncbi:ExbD/TolR family protein [Salinimicrobium xinjiangense]|uniref:ExbD/TolR family protein n=1 Tax=Salinimicrobium xinjiangense TaxID=438596 RepID=UPI0004145912|nr:biopolymer transporter ExbD [Salinimicrobium xinjiangense]